MTLDARSSGARVAGRSRALLCGLAIAAAAVGCKKKKSPDDESTGAVATPPREAAGEVQAITWAVDEVSIQLVAEEGRERDLDATGLAQRIGSGLRATDHFTTGDGEAAAGRRLERAEFRARITYGVIPEGSLGKPSAFVAVEGALGPLDSSLLALRENVITERPLADGETAAATDEALPQQIIRAVDEMVAGVVAKEALRAAGPEKLRAALGSGETGRVQWALELVERRELRSLADTVRGLLTSSDTEIADSAISTAVALGDQKAVKALTGGIDFQDHERMRVVIEASAALGGDEARQFLEFVATGHEDDDVKKHAADALERLSDRR